MSSWKSESHVFSSEGRRILYNVQSGGFFEMDTVVGTILESTAASREEIIAELSPTLGFDQVVGALEELEAAELVAFGPRCPLTVDPSAAPSPNVYTMSGTQPGDSPGLAQSLAEMDSRSDTVTMTLHVSHACNISCTYCFALGGSYGGKPEIMEWDTARQAVDWLLAISAESGRCQLDFFGGEPLLAIDLMKEIVDYGRAECAKRGMTIAFGMTTNGTLLDGDALEFLMKEDIGIMVSIDGPKEDHDTVRKFHNGADTFDIVADRVQKVVDRRPDKAVKLRSTMTSNNLNMPDIASRLSDFGVDEVTISPVWESPHSPTSIRMEHVDELNGHLKALADDELATMIAGDALKHDNFSGKLKQVLNPQNKRQYGCGGGKTYFGVDVKGDIYFCSAFGSLPEYKMGDVWKGLDRQKDEQFRRELHVDNRQGCSTCWARNLCGGGCAYDARVSTGSWEGPNPVACERTRYGFELAMGMALELQEANPGALDNFRAETLKRND